MLGSRLREAIASKQYAGLSKIVSRLLDLQPRNADALSVGAQLQKKCRVAAEEKLGQYQYEQALKVIEQIPRPLWTAETAEFYQRLADLAWLATTLRTAAVIDPVLVAAGRRAAELMPGDPGIAKLTEELERRVKRSEKDDGSSRRPWAAPPAKSSLGPPLEWNAGFRRIVVSEECDRQALVDGRGCYGVACGLALQGLGLAVVQTDLRPKEKARVVDFVSSIVGRNGSRGAWGIDIGSSSLKAVKLVPGEKDGKPCLEIALCIEHRKSLGQANNELEEQALLEETLATLLAKHDLRNGYVVVGLSGRVVFSRMFKLPPSDRRKLEAMVQHEVQQTHARRCQRTGVGLCDPGSRRSRSVRPIGKANESDRREGPSRWKSGKPFPVPCGTGDVLECCCHGCAAFLRRKPIDSPGKTGGEAQRNPERMHGPVQPACL